MLRERAEVIVHLAHNGAIPIPLSKGEKPLRTGVRVAKLRAKVDVTPKALPPLPTESEEIEIARRTKKGGRFHQHPPFNSEELAHMVGRRHHTMPREVAAEIAKQFDLSDREQVDLIGQVKICRKGTAWFASKYIEGNMSKEMKLEHTGSALQKVAKAVEAIHGPTFSDAEID